jgi:hypothetical protein
MNCLLLGQKTHFNREGLVLHKSNLNEELENNYHHAIGLDTDEIKANYSADLRALVMECLLRESTKRPSAVDLVIRCKAGKKSVEEALKYLRVAQNPLPVSDALSTMPFIPLKPPEPPQEWVNDIDNFEYDMSDETFADHYMIPQVPLARGLLDRAARGFGSVASSIKHTAQIFTPPDTPSPNRAWGDIGGYIGSKSPPSSPTPQNFGKGPRLP